MYRVTISASQYTLHADGSIIAIATSSGDVSVYALADMRRLYHITNVTALLMPHELMSCPDFTGHVVISITPAYAPAPAASASEVPLPLQPLLLLGLSCGIVVVVNAGEILYMQLTLPLSSPAQPSQPSHSFPLQPQDPAAAGLVTCRSRPPSSPSS